MGPSDLLPSSPMLVLLSSRQITSSLSAFLSLGCDAADACLAVSPGEAGQEARTKGEGKCKKKKNQQGLHATRWNSVAQLVDFTPSRVQHVAAGAHRWCIWAAAAPASPPASAGPAVASSAAPPAGQLWSRPPAGAPSVTSCEVRQSTADGRVFRAVILRHAVYPLALLAPSRQNVL